MPVLSFDRVRFWTPWYCPFPLSSLAMGPACPLTPTCHHQPGRARWGPVTNKASASSFPQHSTWLPNVGRHKAAYASLLLAGMRLISEQDKHARCFPVSGGQPIEARLSTSQESFTPRVHVNTHTHTYLGKLLSSPK